jgi:polysaccharide export outer membrane protein
VKSIQRLTVRARPEVAPVERVLMRYPLPVLLSVLARAKAARFGAPAIIALCLGLAACAGPNIGPNMAVGSNSYNVIPAPAAGGGAQDYIIGPLDTIDITVFQEADISAKGLVVDASGNISMPLVGRIEAAGRTTTQLADELARKLGERFYVNPQVSVSVAGAVSQRVTVEGQVTEPGIYQIRGPTTLLDAVALAKGETDNASLKQVVVIRNIDGKRMAAAFNIERIRRGDDLDPAIYGRDVIIVGHSNQKQIWHDLLKAAPLLNVFAQF